jgi:hypothetical protein
MLRLPPDNVFGGEEALEVLPNDFMGLVAKEVLCAGIPTEHVSFKVDKEQGVLFRIGGEQVEALSHFVR